MKNTKRLITSALPYVNNVPHLGNIIGAVLSADVFARYCRSNDFETLYICGTDEHGTATEAKALQEKLTPQEICDKYYAIHKEIYKWFNISFDYFGRTSTQEQKEITQEIFLKLYKNRYIEKDVLEQLYCIHCKRFLADRYVNGTCPYCKYGNARGDQCESCGKLLNPIELEQPKCSICGSQPIVKKTNHLFLSLDKIKPKLEKWFEKTSVEGFWSNNSIAMTGSWLKSGLSKKCITRDLEWGISVPLEEFKDKVFYVWFDAPIGYISITKGFIQEWESWWKNPKQVKLFQFMGKDNIPFHTVIFPSSLLGTEDNYTLPFHISSTEFLNYESGKFSKSLGTGVFGDEVMKTDIPSDVWRFYLLKSRPEKKDTLFQWNDFQDKVNNELLANVGNLINRVIQFISKFFDNRIPEIKLSREEITFLAKIKEKEKYITDLFENVKLKSALNEILSLSSIGNKFFQDSEPWKLIKENKENASRKIKVLANIIKDIAILLEPFIPETSKEIFSLLNTSNLTWKDLNNEEILPGKKIASPKILFKRIENEQIDKLRKHFSGKK